MQIWMDGDACPRPIKEVLFRAAIRTRTLLIVVANHYVPTPNSPFIKKQQVSGGFDVADHYIVNTMVAGDLIVTADIPLADLVVSKGGAALNPRGKMYTHDNIKQQLAVRNLNESLRSSALLTGGVAPLNQKDIRDFSNSLDRFLSKI